MDIDVHDNKSEYERMKVRANATPACENKEYLLKYIEFLDNEITQQRLVYSSATRNLRYAIIFSDAFYPNIIKASQGAVEDWFAKEIQKNAVHGVGAKGVVKTNKKLSVSSHEKIKNQCEKFLKFVYFLQKNKPVILFNSKRAPIPLQTEDWYVNTKTNKEIVKPDISQDQIKSIIDYCFSTGNYLDEELGVLVSFLNDSGCRFSEGVTLLEEDFKVEGNYLIVKLRQSKTKTRTLSLLLCKEHILHWLRKFPNKGKNGLVFCSKDGNKVSYPQFRDRFKEILAKLNIKWAENKAFHYLRHLTACRFGEWDGDLASYWFGWTSRGNKMRERYSNYTYKTCQNMYVKTLKQEKNPMLDVKLSAIDEQQQDFVKNLEEELYYKIKNRLEKQK